MTHWKMDAQRLLRAQVVPETAVGLSRGRSRLEATRILLETLPLDSPPSIQLKPSWWPWLPVFPFRISVTIGN